MTIHLGQRYSDDFSDATPLDDLLTAYLDGELGTEERANLENRLAKEVVLRTRLVELRQAYDLLDDLPETPHDQRFTQSTIEHVIQSVSGDVGGKGGPHHRPKRTTGPRWRIQFPILLVVSILLGTALGLVARGIVIKREIDNLSLIANLDGLQSTEDIEVVEELSEDQVAFKLLKQRFSRRFVPNVPSMQERPAWVESLTPSQKSEIYLHREQLGRLTESERKKVRALNTKILESEASSSLQETVRLVGLVTDSLMPNDKLALVGMPPEDRVVYLREKIFLAAADYYFTTEISDSDQEAIKQWFDDSKFVMMSQLGGFRGFGPPGSKESTPESRMESLINLYAASLMSPFESRDEERVALLLESLHPELSELAQDLLQALTPTEQLVLVFNYLAPNRLGSDRHFIERYLNLPPQFQERLDLSAPSEIRLLIMQEPLRVRG